MLAGAINAAAEQEVGEAKVVIVLGEDVIAALKWESIPKCNRKNYFVTYSSHGDISLVGGEHQLFVGHADKVLVKALKFGLAQDAIL